MIMSFNLHMHIQPDGYNGITKKLQTIKEAPYNYGLDNNILKAFNRHFNEFGGSVILVH